MRKLFVGLVVFVTACSQGVAAPPVTGTETVCTDAFCIDVPVGWTVTDRDNTYVSFSNEVDPENTFLTAGPVNMEALVTAAGRTWPVPMDEVVLSFWSMLEEAGVGKYGRSRRMVGGAVRSWGEHETGTMWQLMYPLGGSAAIGIGLRAPNGSWEKHADVVFESVTVSP